MTVTIHRDARGRPLAITGSPTDIESAAETQPEIARSLAAGVFADEDRLCAFEMGEARYPAAVERVLDSLIAERNRTEDA